MRLKLYCNRYAHFKDALVCSVNCVYRTRCRDFALFYDEHRAEVDALVGDYYQARRAEAPARALPVVAPVAQAVDVRELIRLEVKREMAEAMFIWIDKEGRAELLEHDEVLRRAARGHKPVTIYKVAQEMELRFQLVPRKRIEKAKRAAADEAERAAARRAARHAPARAPLAPVPAADAPEPDAAAQAPTRRPRRLKAVRG
ncbi:MAG TPA: hypothetical protein VF546_20200 [Pyrinomonadaceae bacterium]|jgi:hypothetical protein